MTVRYNVPLAPYTTFRIGGPADIFITAESEEDILKTLADCRAADIPLTVLGAGSNVLIGDSGMRGAVLYTGSGFNKAVIKDGAVTAEAGARLSKIALMAGQSGLSGLEFAAHIPGTLGGALFMNAGAFGADMAGVTAAVRAADRQGRCVREYGAEECGFGYRQSVFQSGDLIITGAVLRLTPAGTDEIREKTESYLLKRKNTQPLGTYNAGSVFKAAGGIPAGRLIDGLGLKGLRAGGAEISRAHANFIVNTGGAAAKDVLSLIYTVQDKVYSAYGVKLELEIKLIGV